MDQKARLEAYFEKDGPFREGMRQLREIVLETSLEETLKWNAPVYCMDGKNVLGILAFKNHFGLWFYQGVFMKDPLGVLQNAQEGKTRYMRHWKFTHPDQVEVQDVQDYMHEAIAIAKKGPELPKSEPKELILPPELEMVLEAQPGLRERFDFMPPYKKRDFAEYISTAKQKVTRERRLQKCIGLIEMGIGLNDQYRNKQE